MNKNRKKNTVTESAAEAKLKGLSCHFRAGIKPDLRRH